LSGAPDRHNRILGRRSRVSGRRVTLDRRPADDEETLWLGTVQRAGDLPSIEPRVLPPAARNPFPSSVTDGKLIACPAEPKSVRV